MKCAQVLFSEVVHLSIRDFEVYKIHVYRRFAIALEGREL